ncbi:MAG: hypothetical protein JWM47_4363, partial [Acidimicrobiales bacterium]|nr:hypothetical protein [Acidimicrobiales bacterium]
MESHWVINVDSNAKTGETCRLKHVTMPEAYIDLFLS